MAKPLATILKKYSDVISGKLPASEVSALTTGKEPGVDYASKMPDEREFVASHSVEKHPDRNGNDDEVFKASKIKQTSAEGGKHGYMPDPKSKSVYTKANEEVEQIDERKKATHKNPLVTVHDKNGPVTHALLSTANDIHNTNVKAADIHNGKVKVTSGHDKNKALIFNLSKHHEKEVNEENQNFNLANRKTTLAERIGLKNGKVNEEAEQIDELSRDGVLSRYLNKARDKVETGEESPDKRAEGRALAGKKKWGGSHGLPGAKIPATGFKPLTLEQKKKANEKIRELSGNKKGSVAHTNNGRNHFAIHDDKVYSVLPKEGKLIVNQFSESKDEREYGYEGDMAITQLKTIMRHSEHLIKMMKPDTDLPEWVQSKITKAEDYISTAHDYLMSEMNEAYDKNMSEMVCEACGDSYGKPTNESCKYDSKDKNGKNWVSKEQASAADKQPMYDGKKKKGRQLILDKDIQEREMTAAEKKKEESLKDKYDDSDMKAKMMKQYGAEKGKKVYFAYIRKKAMQKEQAPVDSPIRMPTNPSNQTAEYNSDSNLGNFTV